MKLKKIDGFSFWMLFFYDTGMFVFSLSGIKIFLSHDFEKQHILLRMFLPSGIAFMAVSFLMISTYLGICLAINKVVKDNEKKKKDDEYNFLFDPKYGPY